MTDYTTLQATIADWLDRQDLAPVIPSFIRLAEAEIERKVRTSDMEARAVVTVDEPYVSLPADFLQLRRLSAVVGGAARQLPILTAEQMGDFMEAHPEAGPPQVAAVVAGQIQLGPAPDGQYELELVYYRKIPALSGDNPTNWLLEKYPDAYLYGALQHSAPYIRDDGRVAMWADKFTAVLREIGAADERALYGNAKLAATTTFRW